jgi:ketosteroid isomerase-like protein
MPMTMSLEQLADRARITDTLHAYCDFVDACQVDRIIDLFTEDALIDMGHDASFQGRAALRSLLLDRLSLWATTSHHSSNVRFIDCDGQSATTISYIYAYHANPGEDRAMHLWGRYLDELTKESETWRIRLRRLRVADVSYARSGPLAPRFERFARSPLPQD